MSGGADRAVCVDGGVGERAAAIDAKAKRQLVRHRSPPPPSRRAWASLGATAPWRSWPASATRADFSHPRSRSCFQRAIRPLVGTLERYLDHGGDARAASTELFIHRSTLYGRLNRIKEITGLDLRSGDGRLELHLALRLWRLAGGSLPPDRRRLDDPTDATAGG
jgi:hypothetical protein